MDEYIQNIKNNFDKYIIIYYDKDSEDDINNLLNDSKLEPFKIIIFYKKMYVKKYNSQRIIEILYDDFSEKILLEKSYMIILFNQGSESIILNNFIRERDDIENGIFLFYNKKSDIILDIIGNNIEEYNNFFLENRNKFIENFDAENKKYQAKKSDEKKYEDKKNINIIKNREELKLNDGRIYIATYFKEFTEPILNLIQKKCILENINNNNVQDILILGKNLLNNFGNIEINHGKKLYLQEIEHEITYKDLFFYANTYFPNNIIAIVKSDIILVNSDEMNNIEFDLLEDKLKIIGLSRFERALDGKICKINELSQIFYSTEQDAYFYRTPFDIDYNYVEKLEFYEKFSELKLNNYFIKNNYNLINDTKKYRIIRLCYDNNIMTRKLIKNIDVIENIDDMYLLPENIGLDNINVEQLIQMLRLTETDIYKIKTEIINKYMKGKIFIS